MRRALLLLCLLTLMSCAGRDGKNIKDSEIVFYRCELGKFWFQEHIGNDKESALDSLMKLKTNLPDTSYVVALEQVNVGTVLATGHCDIDKPGKACVHRYSNDDKQFYAVTFKRGNLYLQPPEDIIDNQGNWYILEVNK